MQNNYQQLLIDAAGDNRWRTLTFERSNHFSKLFDNGIVSRGSPLIQTYLNLAVLPSLIEVGYAKLPFEEYNISEKDSTKVEKARFKQKKLMAKTNVMNNWVEVSNLEGIYFEKNKVIETIQDYFSKKLYADITAIISNILNGLSFNKNICVGGPDKPFTKKILNSLLEKRGGHRIGEIKGAFMNRATFVKILSDWDVEKHEIKEKRDIINILGGDKYTFSAVTIGVGINIYLDDKIKPGICCFLNKNSFIYESKKLETISSSIGGPTNAVGQSVLRHSVDHKDHGGSGTNSIIMDHSCIITPRFFSFVGKHNEDYKSEGGLYINEWANPKLFEYSGKSEDCPISILQIKMDKEYKQDGSYGDWREVGVVPEVVVESVRNSPKKL